MKTVRKNGKKRTEVIAAAVACALLSAVLFGLFSHLGGLLQSQRAAERFRGDNEQLFSQVSAYFPVDGGITVEDLYSFRQTLESKFVETSLETPTVGSLYKDAYCATGSVTVEGEKGSAEVTVLGVGGDFFYFHPYELRSGSYISGDDLMHDGVVLDEELAWRLFGGVDLAGMTVMIGEEPYRVAGVISREDDFASSKAYTLGAGMFMAYDKLNAISETKISCYELVSADPIEGFALSILDSGFPAAVTVENSSRFSAFRIFDVIRQFGTRSMSTAPVVYPYWENAARYVEDVMALIIIPMLLLAVPIIVVAVWVVRSAIRRLVAGVKKKVPEAADRLSERRYERVLRKKAAVAGKDR